MSKYCPFRHILGMIGKIHKMRYIFESTKIKYFQNDQHDGTIAK